MHVKKIAKDLFYANLEVVRRMGLLYDNKGGEGKKKGYEKNALATCLLTVAMDTQGTCQGFMPRWPQLSKPFTSFAKIPTRDPEILPCYWLYVVNARMLPEYITHV